MTFFIRTFPLIIFFVVAHHLSNAQGIKLDTLITKDYQKLEVRILEVAVTTITYQLKEEAPITIPKSIVSYIVWGDGKREILSPPYETKIKGISKLGPLRKWNLERIDSDQLEEFHNICKIKSKRFNTIGLVGLTTALVGPVATIVAVKNSKSDGDYAEGFGKAIAAAMFTGITFVGGTTVAAIGFSRSRNYTRKKLILEDELGRRNQPLNSLRLSPGFNPVSQSGHLTLRMSF